jgi:hypothetical protein
VNHPNVGTLIIQSDTTLLEIETMGEPSHVFLFVVAIFVECEAQENQTKKIKQKNGSSRQNKKNWHCKLYQKKYINIYVEVKVRKTMKVSKRGSSLFELAKLYTIPIDNGVFVSCTVFSFAVARFFHSFCT